MLSGNASGGLTHWRSTGTLPNGQVTRFPIAPPVDAERFWEPELLVIEPAPQCHVGDSAIARSHLRGVQIGGGGIDRHARKIASNGVGGHSSSLLSIRTTEC